MANPRRLTQHWVLGTQDSGLRTQHWFPRLALAAAIGTYLLIVMGAVVRVTGSGLGCPDWPLCHGRLIPPLETTAIIEYTHRLLGAVVSPLILAVCAAAWLGRRTNGAVLLPATLVPLLLVVQIGLGAVVVRLELPAMVVLVHFGFALLILGLLTWIVAWSTSNPPEIDQHPQPGSPPAVSALRSPTTFGTSSKSDRRTGGATAGVAGAPPAAGELILATTTSTQDTGLLDLLVPMFEQQSGYRVKTVSVGTGAALALGARGEADVVLVHAPDAERAWMAEGNGTERLLVMHNDFVVVGPDDDPAAIRGLRRAVDALRKVADAQAPFISRGDNSGTHQLELKLWKEAQLEPKGRPWYVESGSGMSLTLSIADQRQAYSISDRGTWLSRKNQLALPILVEGDPELLNVYHVMPVNPQKFPNLSINAAGGKAFADFLVSPATQQVIADFGKDRIGQPLFFPDAGKREEELTAAGA